MGMEKRNTFCCSAAHTPELAHMQPTASRFSHSVIVILLRNLKLFEFVNHSYIEIANLLTDGLFHSYYS